MFDLFSFIIFVTRLEIKKILLTRQINNNIHQYAAIVRIMFTVVALGPVTCQTNGSGSQLTTVNKKRIIHLKLPVVYILHIYKYILLYVGIL